MMIVRYWPNPCLAVYLLKARGAKSVKLCVLLDKPQGRVAPIEADYVGDACTETNLSCYGIRL